MNFKKNAFIEIENPLLQKEPLSKRDFFTKKILFYIKKTHGNYSSFSSRTAAERLIPRDERRRYG